MISSGAQIKKADILMIDNEIKKHVNRLFYLYISFVVAIAVRIIIIIAINVAGFSRKSNFRPS
jgi:hypothetical protein